MKTFMIIEWQDDSVVMLDQRKLPEEETYVTCVNYKQVMEAINNMTIRGAPAIGVAAAMGMALAAIHSLETSTENLIQKLSKISEELFNTRPTAVNLKWGLDRIKNLIANNNQLPVDELKRLIVQEVIQIKNDDIKTNMTMGKHGATILEDGDTVLTHCNAGALATAGWGTAVGVVYSAIQEGKKINLIADETRPVLQGARLTAWEAHKMRVPVTVICDNMAASLMAKGKIDKVLVGADRVAANGDAANKIGTYSVAINAKYHGIPFYVVAPFSTIDPNTPTGKEIPIEERNPLEVTTIGNRQITPDGVGIYNPAFDVTPNELITGIITEKGIFERPFRF